MTPVEELLARERIRDLALRYSVAIADRDVELMVSLYADEASFGSFGSGAEALRRVMASTMGDLRFGVILVANHLIDFTSETEATGEVWARCYAQNDGDGYYEQLIKYVDHYVDVTADPGAPGLAFPAPTSSALVRRGEGVTPRAGAGELARTPGGRRPNPAGRRRGPGLARGFRVGRNLTDRQIQLR